MNVTGANSVIVYRGAPRLPFSPSEGANRPRRPLPLKTSPQDSLTSRSHLRNLVRPMGVLFIALALAVALWGFGYKWSLYQSPLNHPLQVSVAKMGLGPERQPSLSGNNATRFHFGPAPSTQIDLAIAARPTSRSGQSRWPLSEATFAATGVSFQSGSRSPPSRILSMRSLVVA